MDIGVRLSQVVCSEHVEQRQTAELGVKFSKALGSIPHLDDVRAIQAVNTIHSENSLLLRHDEVIGYP